MALGRARTGGGLMIPAIMALLGGGVAIAAPFLAVYGGTGADYFYGSAFDSAGNVFVCGYNGSTGKIGATDGMVLKFDKVGNLLWAKTYGAATFQASFYGIAVTSADDVIVCGFSNEPGYGSLDGVLLKLSGADGSIIWQRELGSASVDGFYAVAIDASGNIACVGGNTKVIIAYYNSSGTLQWQRTLTNGTGSVGYAVCFDASGNIYVSGAVNTNSSPLALVAKYNSSGTIQWKSTIANSSSWVYGAGIAVDASNNPHVLAYDLQSSLAIIAKLNSTASSITWQRTLSTTANGNYGYNCLKRDSTGNLYALVYGLETQDDAVLAVYNSSGTLQFKNRIRDDMLTHDVYVGSLAINATHVAIAGDTTAVGAGSRDGYLLHVPIDGGSTGTRNTIEYEASGMTDAAGAATIATATTTTDAAGTLTSGTPALSPATLSLTLTVS